MRKLAGLYMYTYIHTYMHTYIHIGRIYIHTYRAEVLSLRKLAGASHTYIRMWIYTYIHPYMHVCIHTYIHTYIHPYIHIRMHRNMQSRCIRICRNRNMQSRSSQKHAVALQSECLHASRGSDAGESSHRAALVHAATRLLECTPRVPATRACRGSDAGESSHAALSCPPAECARAHTPPPCRVDVSLAHTWMQHKCLSCVALASLYRNISVSVPRACLCNRCVRRACLCDRCVR